MRSIEGYTVGQKIVGNLLFWVGIWLVIALILSNDVFAAEAYLRSGLLTTAIAILTYWNLQVLIPQLLLPKKYLLYIILSIASILLVSWFLEMLNNSLIEVSPEMERRMRRGKRFFKKFPNAHLFRLLSRLAPLLVAYVISSIYEITRVANRREQESIKLQSEKLETEMKFLKSQINPHFLFNALNNIYSLTVMKSDSAPDNLMKLSNMLRYMLYDCSAEKVPLQKEIAYLKNYIDLQLLKDSRGLNVKVDLEDGQPNLMIAPMLFIPFVENAFKHSKIEDLKTGWIELSLKTVENTLHFSVANSIPDSSFSKDKAGGIGLKNVERQLDLLYPQRHQLSIDQDKDRFSVDLKILGL